MPDVQGGSAATDGDGRDPSAATPPGVDVGPVSAWLERILPGATPPFSFSRIGDGRSNLTFRVTDAAGTSWILRRPPLGPRLRGAHDMPREHRLLAALHPAGVRVPEPFGLCEDEDVTGAPFYVMELAEGHAVATAGDLGPLGPAERAVAGRSLVDALVGLHEVDIDAAGLGDLARREGYAARQLKGWWRQWEASRTREIPGVERVRDVLAASVPPQRRDAVVHGDYKLENVILGDDGEVRAILDWELCTLGDPIADLGTLLTYWIEPGDPFAWALGGADAPTRADGFATRAEIAERYARATGDPLDGLPFFEAQGCWKLAIILQGVVRRFRDTPENANADPDTLDPVIDGLIDRAEARLAG
ncbi:phosphotransferase family protein [Patulibacter minatonensis]|uniref:phosphotransferase family protein n=1 Tax=Patulibacter minatonensis TaxID=298163 RepID=UPI0006846DD8|nr:phosphotransferase family protein [Patulibacter minatonensis]